MALYTGLASGAEAILVPEIPFDLNIICEKIISGYKIGRLHSIIVVAEGAADSINVGKIIKESTALETRVIILGHLQRGGAPSAYDRILASRFGGEAVNLLKQNIKGKMLGEINGELITTDMEKVLETSKPLDMEMYRLTEILSH